MEGGTPTTTYAVERSKSGRAACKDVRCKEKIAKDEIRICKEFVSNIDDHQMKNYFHLRCFFSSVMLRMKQSPPFTSPSEISGYSTLSRDDQAQVDAEFDRAQKIKEDPKQLQSVRSAVRKGKSNGEEKKEDEEEKEEKPSKAAASKSKDEDDTAEADEKPEPKKSRKRNTKPKYVEEDDDEEEEEEEEVPKPKKSKKGGRKPKYEDDDDYTG